MNMSRRRFALTGAVAGAASLMLGKTASAVTAAVALRKRAETDTVTATAGVYNDPFPGSLGGRWLLFRNTEYVTLQGTGYFQIRWEPEYWKGLGEIILPTFTGRRGTLLHVASGGRRFDDVYTHSGAEPGQSMLGRPSVGYQTLPAGTPMLWHNEHYWLSGTVTVTCHEGSAKYNLGLIERTWQNVYDDINSAADGRIGLSYDK
jgi:hypothetical protein